MIPIRSIFLAAATVIYPGLANSAFAEPVNFDAIDGVTVYADFRQAEGKPRGIILLFHMAGSNKSEYAPLAPILNKAGFATLAVDQRSGGNLWGSVNETVAQAKVRANYADVLPDLDAAIDFGIAKQSGPIAVWGSSYSSALGFIAATRHQEVKALLAFSPAEYIQGHSIKKAASNLTIPIFVTSAPDEGEISSGHTLVKAVPGHTAVQFIQNKGVHGSSTLRTDQNPEGARENWQLVMAFLDTVFPATNPPK